MGVLDSQAECLAALDGYYASAHSYRDTSWTKQAEAYTHYLAGEVLPCLYDTLWALGELTNSITYLMYQSDDNPLHADILYYLANYAGVTYKSIVEAWGKDDFEGRAVTIAFIDRMRQMLWNEPYNVIWAARPEKQESPF